jgi:pyridoxamine 5'-phosphate oxidase
MKPLPPHPRPRTPAPAPPPTGRRVPNVVAMVDDLATRRREYESAGLDTAKVATGPLDQWRRWYADASLAGLPEPHAMTVATVGIDGRPDARVVLARGVDERSIVFFTNYDSAKSEQLTRTPYAAAVFLWVELHRQVRIRGVVERATDAESDAYWSARPRESQIAAAASPQSAVIPDRAHLERLYADTAAQFADGDVPRPAFWGGWRIVVEEAEFWQGRRNRLHDRIRYRRDQLRSAWSIERLAP